MFVVFLEKPFTYQLVKAVGIVAKKEELIAKKLNAKLTSG